MSDEQTGLHVWTADGWRTLDWCDPHEGRLLVADSWRVRDGRVRGLVRHRDRFVGSVGVRHADAAAAFDAAVALLPRTGDWFPRIELRERTGDPTMGSGSAGATLALRVRPTPPTTTEVVVATAPVDPRTHPRVKGPDLDALQRLRSAVQPLGAGEAIIVDAPGHIVEGAYSGVLWWRGETLVQPAATLARIPSVTVSLVLDAARAEGVTIASETVTPAGLAGCELWVLSALHGLRTASAWVDGPRLADARHADRGRRWLSAAEHITPLTGG